MCRKEYDFSKGVRGKPCLLHKGWIAKRMRNKIKSALRQISEDTSFYSFFVEHDRLDEIVEMGEDAVPYLIEHLEESIKADANGFVDYDFDDYTPWYTMAALRRITGARPIREKNRGRLIESIKDWTEWYDRSS
jgi:hypothetical protein